MAAKKNGLGKGLDSLISDKVKTTPGKSTTVEVTDEKAEKINFLKISSVENRIGSSQENFLIRMLFWNWLIPLSRTESSNHY